MAHETEPVPEPTPMPDPEPGDGAPLTGKPEDEDESPGSWTDTIVSPNRLTRSFTRTDLKPGALPTAGAPLPEALAALPAGRQGRYTLAERLGADAAGRTWSAHDNALDRPVLLKVLQGAKAAAEPHRLRLLLQEARLTARLDHAGIAPVHHLEQSPAGDLLLVSRRVEGPSLGAALRASARGEPLPELTGWRSLAMALLKVCDPLAFAHERGILHCDLKPDHVVAGRHGEVVLTGWHSARPLGEDPMHEGGQAVLTGTPAYMSPEQARHEALDARSDVYGLGATLWHLCTGQPPTWAATEEEFWAKKRAGVVDPPTVDQLTQVPDDILAVARQALAAEKGGRHPSVRAFAADLEEALARHPAKTSPSGRWAARRRTRRRRWLVAAACLLLAAALAGPTLLDTLTRGDLVYAQDFEDESWTQHLLPLRSNLHLSAFKLQDGRLVTTGPRANFAFFDQPLTGRVVVEFTGETLPDTPPCDLSLVWTPDDPRSSPQPLSRTIQLQVGAYDNEFASITIENNNRVAMNPFRLEPGRKYRFRYECDGTDAAISVDGRQLCRYSGTPLAMPPLGWVGLYGYYEGKAFDDLRIWCTPPPERVNPTVVGDSYLRDGSASRAALEFGAIARARPSSQLGQEALFKQGLALMRLGDGDGARQAWSGLAAGRLNDLATCQLLELDFRQERHDQVIGTLRTLYASLPDLRQQLDLLWVRFLGQLAKDPPTADRYLALHGSPIGRALVTDSAAAQLLAQLNRQPEVVQRFPHVKTAAASALIFLGREQEALSLYPDRIAHVNKALYQLGYLEEVIRSPYHNWYLEPALILTGRGEQALERFRQQDSLKLANLGARELALTVLGRWDELEAVAQEPPGRLGTLALLDLHRLGPEAALRRIASGSGEARNSWVHHAALLQLDRVEEALALTRDPRTRRGFLLHAELLARIAGQSASAAALAAQIEALPRNFELDRPGWLAEWVLLPACRQFAGEAAALARSRLEVERRFRRNWACLAWTSTMVASGMMGEAAIPQHTLVKTAHRPIALVCGGIDRELKGDPDAALALYRSYLDLPLNQRLWTNTYGDPSADRFVRWRVAVLAPAPPTDR